MELNYLVNCEFDIFGDYETNAFAIHSARRCSRTNKKSKLELVFLIQMNFFFSRQEEISSHRLIKRVTGNGAIENINHLQHDEAMRVFKYHQIL